MNNITPMFANNSALQAIRDGGYGSAGFDIATAPLVYEARTDECDENVVYRDPCSSMIGRVIELKVEMLGNIYSMAGSQTIQSEGL